MCFGLFQRDTEVLSEYLAEFREMTFDLLFVLFGLGYVLQEANHMRHVAVGTDDGIVYLGLTESIPRVDSRGMIVKTTRDGDFVWRRTYDMEAVSGLVRTGDGFVAVGEPPFGSTDLDAETLVYTLDSRGRLRETVGLTSSVGDLTGVVRLNQNSVAVAGTEFSDGPWVRAVVLA